MAAVMLVLPAEADTATVPGEVLPLSNWKLQLPEADADGYALEVRQPTLSTYVHADFFRVDGGAVEFVAPVDGATTSGSTYPRAELREMNADGTKVLSWSTRSGRHDLSVTQSVDELPVAKPDVVAVQIHDGSSDMFQLLVDGDRGATAGTAGLCLRHRGVLKKCLTTSYVLGTSYELGLSASRGYLTVTFNGATVLRVKDSCSTCYFKAGAYTLSNLSKGDVAGAAGKVSIARLSVAHR